MSGGAKGWSSAGPSPQPSSPASSTRWTSRVCRWSVTPNPVTNGFSKGSRTSSTSARRIGARSTSASSAGRTSVLLVDRRPPLAVLGHLAANDLEVAPLQREGRVARLARADHPAVDLGHGGHLHAGAHKEHLVSREKLAAVDARLVHVHAQLAGQLEHHAAGDPDEDVVAALGRKHLVTGDEEDVARRCLGEMPIAGEHQRLVEPLAS